MRGGGGVPPIVTGRNIFFKRKRKKNKIGLKEMRLQAERYKLSENKWRQMPWSNRGWRFWPQNNSEYINCLWATSAMYQRNVVLTDCYFHFWSFSTGYFYCKDTEWLPSKLQRWKGITNCPWAGYPVSLTEKIEEKTNSWKLKITDKPLSLY